MLILFWVLLGGGGNLMITSGSMATGMATCTKHHHTLHTFQEGLAVGVIPTPTSTACSWLRRCLLRLLLV